jgi:hypothetical protein
MATSTTFRQLQTHPNEKKARMRILVTVCLLGIGSSTYGQTPQTGPATAIGECAVSHSGNYDRINIKNCGIGEEQGKKIIDLLKAVLANQNHDQENAKLDELLVIAKRFVNKYGTATTYDPNGSRREVTQSTGTVTMNDSATKDYKTMLLTEKSANWRKQIEFAHNAIEAYPDWFTPHLFLGEAQAHLCMTSGANASLSRFVDDTANATTYSSMNGDARKMLAFMETEEYRKTCSTPSAEQR